MCLWLFHENVAKKYLLKLSGKGFFGSGSLQVKVQGGTSERQTTLSDEFM